MYPEYMLKLKTLPSATKQDAAKGKILRIAHLGYFGPFDILTSVTALEMTLTDLGVRITRGAGTAAAEAILASA